MSFLTPLFLAGLAALAVPVLIHLIQRERKQVVEFPSLMFVRRIPYQSVRRRRIRHLALLLARLAALALIVLAFARPFLPAAGRAAGGGLGAREVVILLDRSYSMTYAGRWERAREAARDAIEALAPADRATLVLFDSRAEATLRSTADRSRLLAALDSATPGVGATRYAPALQVAGSILGDSSLPRREAILISDLQRLGWRDSAGGRLPEGAVLTPVKIADDATAPNLSVTPVSMSRSMFEGRERVIVTAGVVNRHAEPARGVAVTLTADGQTIQTERIDVAGNGSGSVTFAPVTLGSRPVRASIVLPADALAPDNAFHFVLSSSAPVVVVVADRDGAPQASSLYVARALAIGDAPRVETIRRTAGTITDADLARAAVVWLNDVPVSAALARRVRRFVEGGGGLFVALGPYASWPETGGSLLPGVPGAPVDRTRGDVVRVGALEYGHPVFEMFRAPRSGDFSSIRFFGYRTVTPEVGGEARSAPADQVLARFDTGAPALVARQEGTGRVLLWTSTLDLTWSDFPVKPMFLPFVHRAVRHLASFAEPAPWLTVGQVYAASPTAGTSGLEPRLALTPSGRRVSLDDEDESGVLELAEQGFYEIRRQESAVDATVVASNVDLSESDLTGLDVDEMVAAATGGGQTHAGAGVEAEGAGPPETQERAQRLWWYLLSAGLLLLGAESYLAARLSRAA